MRVERGSLRIDRGGFASVLLRLGVTALPA
jgi:hypothetical protein